MRGKSEMEGGGGSGNGEEGSVPDTRAPRLCPQAVATVGAGPGRVGTSGGGTTMGPGPSVAVPLREAVSLDESVLGEV